MTSKIRTRIAILALTGLLLLSGCINIDKRLMDFKDAKTLCEDINGIFEPDSRFPGWSGCFIIENKKIKKEYRYNYVNNEILIYEEENERND